MRYLTNWACPRFKREATENPPAQLQFHTFSVVVRPQTRLSVDVGWLRCIVSKDRGSTRIAILRFQTAPLIRHVAPSQHGGLGLCWPFTWCLVWRKQPFSSRRGGGTAKEADQSREKDLSYKQTIEPTSSAAQFPLWDKQKGCLHRETKRPRHEEDIWMAFIT